MFTNRSFQCVLIISALAAVAAAIFLQHYFQLLPCPLCIFQRIAYILVAVGALIACLGYNCVYARLTGWIFGLLFALAGFGMALRQVWLQHLPPGSITTCVPGLNYLYGTFSWFKATMLVFQGTSDCAQVTWRLLGLSMAAWSAICFGLFIIIFILSLMGNRKEKDLT